MHDLGDELELIRKLVLTGHLNVPERQALPQRKANASLILSIIEELLTKGDPFRAWWLPDDSMIGCTIMYQGESTGRVSWKYSGIEGERGGSREHSSLPVAARNLLDEWRPWFGNNIDGIPVDWDA